MQSKSTNGDASDVPLKLPPTVDLAAAENLLASLQQSARNGGSLCLDAAAVETLGLPGIQIILSAACGHGRIVVRNPSAGFVGAFEDMGIDWTSSLDCSSEEPSAGLSANDFQGHESQAPEAARVQDEAPVCEADNHCQSDSDDAAGPSPVNADGMQDDSQDHDLQQISGYAMNTRILTIDDSKTMRDMLMLTLAEAGFDVLQAVDGQDGLDVLVNEQVDVVITDINMPRMDGYEVIRQLRRKPEHKSTPILVLTTESETEKKELARQAGATGWLVKPFDPDRLVETVRKVAP